jgi:16S rRNA (cytidine1402-2'-O)-methyltransferase
MLYIVSTPIGNLKDISLRALDVLKNVDAILCEDTRVSKYLLDHYDIHKPLISYHSFNERSRVDDIIAQLKNGQSFALISDAGTPLFQDPGFILVEACQKENIPFTAIPGASSILCAVLLSGLSFNKFQFCGFLSKKTPMAKAELEDMSNYEGLSVFFESPKRTLDTLKLIQTLRPDINVCVIREITKKFETVHRGSLETLIDEFSKEAPRGEVVFVVQGKKQDSEEDFTDFALDLIQQGLSKKSAFQIASKLGKCQKDIIYKS